MSEMEGPSTSGKHSQGMSSAIDRLVLRHRLSPCLPTHTLPAPGARQLSTLSTLLDSPAVVTTKASALSCAKAPFLLYIVGVPD